MTRVPARGVLVAAWVAASVLLGALLLVARMARGPLDDPDPAHQRPGVVDFFGLPEPAPALPGAPPSSSGPNVVFFERRDRTGGLCEALSGHELAEAATLVVVTAEDVPCGAVTVVTDPEQRLGRRFGLREPADGGPPVGYAVVDGAGDIRYRTLDPAVAHQLDEVLTLVEAV